MMSDSEENKLLTGRVPRERIGLVRLPRLPRELLDAFRRFTDLTGLVSDACDALGIAAAIPASILRPTDPVARVVGQAVTVLNQLRTDADSTAAVARSNDNRLGDIEGHNLAEPGDVLVVQGVDLFSSMGSISATIGRRQGEAGAVVDGAVRDIDRSRAIGYPVWSRSVSPVTGKWRLETAGINVPVLIAGVTVAPGDLVIADEVGVCFVPHARAADVLGEAQALAVSEARRQRQIGEGASLIDVAAGYRRS
jgi:regulator of RNase E activity RraA